MVHLAHLDPILAFMEGSKAPYRYPDIIIIGNVTRPSILPALALNSIKLKISTSIAVEVYLLLSICLIFVI